ncbi:hypothetical protein [Streptomyces sp. NPDC059533]|uniref:hypothetical protein n=1 Tax=Streptomyces sp. NPDC059533 TaxID=3346858 RepID=UPI0036A0C07E
MNRPGRPPGPLKGRTPQANELAQFLRDLTAHHTVSQLEARYGGSRSVWSEYRSGQKTIPLSRLKQIIEDLFARDTRTRDHRLQEARRLCIAAMTAAAATTTAAPEPAAAGLTATPDTNENPPAQEPASTTPPPASVTDPDGALRGEDTGISVDNPPTSADATPVHTESAPPQPKPGTGAQTGQGSDGPAASHPPADTGARRHRRARRLERWKIPAQWAALAALVAVLVIANNHSSQQETPDGVSPPGDTAQEQPISAPAALDPTATSPTPPEGSAPTSPPPSASGEPAPPPVPSGWHIVRAKALRLAVAVPDGWKPDVDNALQSTWVSPDNRYVIGVKRDDSNGHTAPAAAVGQLAWYGRTQESKMVALTSETHADKQAGREAVRLEMDYHWPGQESPCHRTELFVTGDGGQVYQLLVNDQQYNEQTSDLPQLLATARAQWRTDLTD